MQDERVADRRAAGENGDWDSPMPKPAIEPWMRKSVKTCEQGYFLYLTQNFYRKGQTAQNAVFELFCRRSKRNACIRYPFDLTFEEPNWKEWSGGEDLNLRPPGPEWLRIDILNASYGVAEGPNAILSLILN